MIQVFLTRKPDGEFVSCRVHGHAAFAARGADIVCSAVTIVLRTCAAVLDATEGVRVTVDAPERGSMSFGAAQDDMHQAVTARLVCIGDVLEQGIASLEREFPGHVALVVETAEYMRADKQ
ncbi:MAG: ribosomal-processing cysteine protease Prp [Treponema sp.]|nr:ribosomal-processing cysteine protease Prp [Treponema sp.]